jgi:uncharacterized protein YjbI with pentapeptide repeats
MANKAQLAILRKGVKYWNKWRAEHPRVKIDLRDAKLNNRNLHEINLKGANLSGASLWRANFVAADLSEADMSVAECGETDFMGADLSKAVLGVDCMGANFSNANLQEADLEYALLFFSQLTSVNVDGAKFKNSVFYSTIISNVDLSKARGLGRVRHLGPSTIGTDTIRLSKGKIPKTFLRGCGLSEWEIELAKVYNPELSGEEMGKTLHRASNLKAAQGNRFLPCLFPTAMLMGYSWIKLVRN